MIGSSTGAQLFLIICLTTSLWPGVESQTYAWQKGSDVFNSYFAKNCDFPGNDLVSQMPNVNGLNDCISKCNSNAQCTHFLWARLGGKEPHYCWLRSKVGEVSIGPLDANTYDSSCGFILPRIKLSQQQANFAWKLYDNQLVSSDEKIMSAKNCVFKGGSDLVSCCMKPIPQEETCVNICKNNPKCTHFQWALYGKDNKGPYCMTRNKSGNDMPSALDAKTFNSTCGFIVPRTIPTISSVTVTNGYTWPDWNYVPKEFCPPGSAAVAFTLKVQAHAGPYPYPIPVSNRAVVGIRLHCGNSAGQLVNTVESHIPQFGTWGEMSPLCKVPLIGSNTIYAKFTSFQLKVHHDYDTSYKFGDWMAVKHSVPDTTMDVLGVTDVAFKCTVPGLTAAFAPNVITVNNGYKYPISNRPDHDGAWGGWSSTCQFGICGLRGKYDDASLYNSKCGDNEICDDAGLTNLEMICCPEYY